MLPRPTRMRLPRCTWDNHFCIWDNLFVPKIDVLIFPGENLEQNLASPMGGGGLQGHFQIIPVSRGQGFVFRGRNAGVLLEITGKVPSLFVAEHLSGVLDGIVLLKQPHRIFAPPLVQELLGRGLEQLMAASMELSDGKPGESGQYMCAILALRRELLPHFRLVHVETGHVTRGRWKSVSNPSRPSVMPAPETETPQVSVLIRNEKTKSFKKS